MENVGIIVKNVYDGGAAMEFNLPLTETLRSLKLQIQDALREKPHPHEQKLIFCGKVWDDGVRLAEILSKMDISTPQTFHLVLKRSSSNTSSRDMFESKSSEASPTSGKLTVSTNTISQAQDTQTFLIDPASLTMARNEYLTPAAQTWPDETRALMHLILNTTDFQINTNPSPAINPGQAANPHPDLNPNVVRWIDIKLLLKIFVALFIFGQGASLFRFCLLVIVGFCYYTLQTGIMQRMFEGLIPSNSASAAASSQTQDNNARSQSFTSSLVTLGSGTVPRQPGLCYDVISLFASLCLSLLPSWQPIAAAE